MCVRKPSFFGQLKFLLSIFHKEPLPLYQV
jgi:hypothetical protein